MFFLQRSDSDVTFFQKYFLILFLIKILHMIYDCFPLSVLQLLFELFPGLICFQLLKSCARQHRIAPDRSYECCVYVIQMSSFFCKSCCIMQQLHSFPCFFLLCELCFYAILYHLSQLF